MIRPVSLTVATEGSVESQVIVLSPSAFDGLIVATNCFVSSLSNIKDVSSKVIPSIGCLTVTLQVAVFFPAVAVITVVPLDRAVTLPVESTEATPDFEEVQVITLSSASDGSIVAVKVSLCPLSKVNSDLFKVTDVAAL